MKKLIFILTVAAIVFTACNKKNPMEVETRPLKDGAQSSIAESRSAHSVHADTAKAWVKNYGRWLNDHSAQKVQQIQMDGKIAEIPNSRSVWFSVEQLEKMILKIKAEQGDGIRFYYASYGAMKPSVDSCTNMPYNYSYLNTLLMVPTKREGCFHRDYYNSVNSISAMDIENKGEICPPPANCNTIGASLIDE